MYLYMYFLYTSLYVVLPSTHPLGAISAPPVTWDTFAEHAFAVSSEHCLSSKHSAFTRAHAQLAGSGHKPPSPLWHPIDQDPIST
jgi:hypothetical protein